MRDDAAGPDGSALSEGLGPNAPAVMSESQKAICAALGAAAAAREQDLRGQYPKAARVLAEEVFRLRKALDQKHAEYEDMKSLLLGNARQLHVEGERLIRELEAHRLYARALCKAVDAATDFAGTVAGGASWWDDVWADHAAALDRAREQITLDFGA